MQTFQRIIVLPDLIAPRRERAEGIFDLVREPIFQGCGVHLRPLTSQIGEASSLPDFDIERFRALAADPLSSKNEVWSHTYWTMPHAAQSYLRKFIPDDALVLTFDSPEWLSRFLRIHAISSIDLRFSPLMFAEDLLVAVRTSEAEIHQRLLEHSVSDAQLRLQAATLGANVRMQMARLESEARYNFDMAPGVVFVGQPENDPALFMPDRPPMQVEDFATELQALSAGRQVYYKSAAPGSAAGLREQAALEVITGVTAKPCLLNTYQLLAGNHQIQLVGLCPDLSEEAKWFGKAVRVLQASPIVLGADISEYQQIHFHKLISAEFWHALLAPDAQAPEFGSTPWVSRHQGRELFDLWGDYAKVLTWERTLPYESFIRSGGGALRDRIARVEHKLEADDVKIHNLPSANVQKAAASALQIKLMGKLYSRLARNYASFEEIAATNTASDKYDRAVLDAAYYQGLHDHNPLFQGNNWLVPYLQELAGHGFSTVREVGCGNGAFITKIAPYVKRAIGLDWARSAHFPVGRNIEFVQKDLTEADLERVDLNCSADVLEHIPTSKLPQVVKALHDTSRFNFHVIACYDDGHSHLSIMPPDAWLALFRQQSVRYRLVDITIRHENVDHVVCVLTNL